MATTSSKRKPHHGHIIICEKINEAAQLAFSARCTNSYSRMQDDPIPTYVDLWHWENNAKRHTCMTAQLNPTKWFVFELREAEKER